MEIIYVHREGSQAERPTEIDTTSSSSVVYLRKNITQVERETEQGSVTLWEYDEAILTKAEYWEYSVDVKQEDMQSQIDYIAMMTDVEL